jgi:DNA primase catalytic core
LEGDLPECWDQVADLITSSGFGLDVVNDASRLGGANGVTDMVARRVTIRADLSGEQQFKTAVHELAHIQLHEPGQEGRPDCRGVVEVEAESVAYMVCASIGVDSAEYSLPYVAAWSGGDLDKVTATANRVIGSARHVIDQLGRHRTLEHPRPVQTMADMPNREDAAPNARRETKGVWEVAAEPDLGVGNDADLAAVVETATGFFEQRLHGPHGNTARDYLTERGFDSATIEDWRLGYAPPSWNALTQHLQSAGFDDQLLVAAGVSAQAHSGRLYDLMRGRVIFPLLDDTATPRGFAGRLIVGDGPKYLNGPETSLYAKRTLLYGLHAARDHIDAAGLAVVVEGYTDALAAHQAGYRNVVATGGTAFTQQQLDSLGDTAREVVLCFDGDAAGQLAAEHNLEWARSTPAKMRVAQLPASQDPSDLLLGGAGERFEQAVANAAPLTTYLLDRIIDRANLDEVEGPIRVLLAAATIIDPIEAPAERSAAVSHLATRLGRDQEFIQSAITRYAGSPQRRHSRDLDRSLS